MLFFDGLFSFEYLCIFKVYIVNPTQCLLTDWYWDVWLYMSILLNKTECLAHVYVYILISFRITSSTSLASWLICYTIFVLFYCTIREWVKRPKHATIFSTSKMCLSSYVILIKYCWNLHCMCQPRNIPIMLKVKCLTFRFLNTVSTFQAILNSSLSINQIISKLYTFFWYVGMLVHF